MKILAFSAVLAVLAVPALAENHATGDAAAGEKAFARQCISCHVVVNEAGETLAGRKAKTGPNLYGMAMQSLGTSGDYRYGASIIAAGEAGTVWTEENFVGYVLDPTGWLRTILDDPKARGKMTFKVRKEEDALNMYAFLASIGPKVAVNEGDVPNEGAEPVPAKIRVSYTSEQADRGEKRYKKDCEECHGKSLKGGMNGGAPIRGQKFETKYAGGAPASSLFEIMSTTMPPNAPGRYSPKAYADLMAYILDQNGIKAGAPLPADLDALDLLIIEK